MDTTRLQEILDEVKELMQEAKQELRGSGIHESRANAYWLGHITTALDNDNEYMGGSMTTMQETIRDLSQKPCDECGGEKEEMRENVYECVNGCGAED